MRIRNSQVAVGNSQEASGECSSARVQECGSRSAAGRSAAGRSAALWVETRDLPWRGGGTSEGAGDRHSCRPEGRLPAG